MKKLIVLMLTLASVNILSSNVTNLIADYEINKMITGQDNQKHQDPNCRDYETGACIKVACSKMSSFECDSRDELRDVTLACRGNYDGSCVQFVTSKLSSFEYDKFEEMQPIINSCKNVWRTSCLQVSTSLLRTFEYREKEDLLSIVNS
ncbi:hypothetical protein OAT67_09000, partial [Bacteriovoracaceae bacterium]|nr:hypothetical protein [Bacteriovoracaceae bacterium]